MANIKRVPGQINTVGSVTSTIVSYAVPNSFVSQVSVVITGKDIASNAVVSFKKIVTFKCFNNIVSVVGGTNIITHKDSGYNSASINEAVSGQNVQFTVTGVSGKTIDWYAIMDIFHN